LQRGPSGRIYRLQIVGSKKSMIVGKELEIRRWLSGTHLYSSAFVVTAERDFSGEVSSFTLHGAGWGHGVGLCQIGAAVMAAQGFKAEEILRHYFPRAEIARVY
jgi:stage II sporulation protein D